MDCSMTLKCLSLRSIGVSVSSAIRITACLQNGIRVLTQAWCSLNSSLGSSFWRASLTSIMVIVFELGFGFCCTKIGPEDQGVGKPRAEAWWVRCAPYIWSGNVGVWDERTRVSSRGHFIKEKCRNLISYDTNCRERGLWTKTYNSLYRNILYIFVFFLLYPDCSHKRVCTDTADKKRTFILGSKLQTKWTISKLFRINLLQKFWLQFSVHGASPYI